MPATVGGLQQLKNTRKLLVKASRRSDVIERLVMISITAHLKAALVTFRSMRRAAISSRPPIVVAIDFQQPL
jgi:hypothetical protein